jgi:hypothetical protein
MRRLLLAAALAAAAAVPAVPAHAGPAVCVAAVGFPVCAGNCQSGDQITVYAVGTGATTGRASCGGSTASCTAFRAVCSGSARAGSSGSLSCGGSAQLVICVVGTQVSS